MGEANHIYFTCLKKNMPNFVSGKPLLPCNLDHLQPGPWLNMPHVVYRIRSAETCACACKLCLNPPKKLSEESKEDPSSCSERCKVHNLKKDPEASKVWKRDYFHPDSYGVRK